MERRAGGRVVGIAVALLGLGGCGTMSSATGPRAAHAANAADVAGVAASCAELTPRRLFAAAAIVVEGRMLPGRTVTAGPGVPAQLVSPARMRVSRYVKGRGPEVVRVQTASAARGSGYVTNAEGIEPVAGQGWRIYSDRATRPLRTSICAGSHRLRSERR